eukprot:GFUD01024647.1.p1 GENE.GFUD01024647.1~~GFUD01024647.1.p1  ORF type:complete len:504 (-),score=120.32 GFUD01024647.1:171-1682(-)
MGRADSVPRGGRKQSSLSSASFRSATSNVSFRSCKSIKSFGSRASFKSVISRDNISSYFSCQDNASVRTGTVNEGYQDNLSFYSFNDIPSLAPVNAVVPIQRQRSVSNANNGDKEVGKDGDEDVPRTHKYLAYLAVIVAASAVAGSTTVTSQVSISASVLLVYRSLLQLVTSFPLLLGTRSNCLGPPGYRWRLYLTGLLTGFLLLALYLAISSLPPRIVAPILMTTPVLTMLLSCVVFGEHTGLYRMLTTSLFLAGVVLLTRPPPLFPNDASDQLQVDLAQYNLYAFPTHFYQPTPPSPATPLPLAQPVDTLGLVAALVAPFLAAFIVILTRQCREVHFSVLLFWSALGSLLVGCIGLYTLRQEEDGQERSRDAREIPDPASTGPDMVNPTNIHSLSNRMFEGPTEWLVATLVAILGIFVNVAITKALQIVPPGKLVLLKSAEVVAGYVLHLCVWGGATSVSAGVLGQSLQWLDLGGAVCVGLAVVFTGVEDLIVDTKRWRWF